MTTTLPARLYNRTEPRSREAEVFLRANMDNARGEAFAYAADYADATCARALAAYYFDDSKGLLRAFATNTARILWDGSIYVEGAATNLALRSDDFTHASWTKTDCTVAASSELGVDGAACGGLLTFKGRGSAATDQLVQSISVSADTNYATSVFAKRAAPQADAVVGLWIKPAVGSSVSTMATTAKWRRSEFYGDSGTPSSPAFGVAYSDGDAESQVLLDAYQVEAGNHATSPISTAGVSVTRPADVVSLANGDWDTGICTAAWEFDIWPDYSSEAMVAGSSAYLFSTSAGADRVVLSQNAGTPVFSVYDGGVLRGASPLPGMTFAARQKLTVRMDPTTATVTAFGAATGDGTLSLSGLGFSWAWTTGGALAVSDASNPFYGRISRPRIVT